MFDQSFDQSRQIYGPLLLALASIWIPLHICADSVPICMAYALARVMQTVHILSVLLYTKLVQAFLICSRQLQKKRLALGKKLDVID